MTIQSSQSVQRTLFGDEFKQIAAQNLLSPVEDKVLDQFNRIYFRGSGVTYPELIALMKDRNILQVTSISFEATHYSLESFEAVTKACPNVKALNLQDCTGLTDDFIEVIAKNCKKLEEIHLSQNISLTKKTLEVLDQAYLQDTSGTLKEVSLYNCHTIDYREVTAFKAKLVAHVDLKSAPAAL